MRSASARSVVRPMFSNTRAFGRPTPRFCRRFATAVDARQKDPTELDQISTLPNGIRVATEAFQVLSPVWAYTLMLGRDMKMKSYEVSATS